MPTTLLTWRQSAFFPWAGATNVAWGLAAINAAVNSEAAANPSTHLWVVANYSAGNGTLVLKPSTNNTIGLATRRLMFFGGVSPNTAATGGATASAAYLYGGTAPTANVDSPQQAYGTGAPFTTGDWVGSGSIGFNFAFGGANHGCRYFENADGIALMLGSELMAGASVAFCGFLGGLAVNAADTAVLDVAWGSDSLLIAGGLGPAVAGGRLLPFNFDAPANVARARMRLSAGTIVQAAFPMGMTTLPVEGGGVAFRSASLAMYIPVVIADITNGRFGGKLRQIAFGPRGTYGDTLPGPAGSSFAFSARTDIAADCLRLCNFRV